MEGSTPRKKICLGVGHKKKVCFRKVPANLTLYKWVPVSTLWLKNRCGMRILRIEIKIKFEKWSKKLEGGVGAKKMWADDPKGQVHVQVKFGDDSTTGNYVMNKIV